ncbi:MAG: HAD family hydrolase [Candidatus Helarchaeota archaeon]
MIRRITSTKILQKINKILKHSDSSVLLVFDLDDTIFDTFYRKSFVYENVLRKKYRLPEFDPIFHKIHYGLKSLLETRKISCEDYPEILTIYEDYFLTNELLSLDRPFPGVCSFFEKLLKFKVQIVFLTARPERTMRTGTILSLNKYIFKGKLKNSHLIMKNKLNFSDREFKRLALKRIIDQFSADKIIIFDNEPENCRIFNELLPMEARVIKFNSIQKSNCKFSGFVLESWDLSTY